VGYWLSIYIAISKNIVQAHAHKAMAVAPPLHAIKHIYLHFIKFMDSKSKHHHIAITKKMTIIAIVSSLISPLFFPEISFCHLKIPYQNQ
jgi:hypothetical protein